MSYTYETNVGKICTQGLLCYINAKNYIQKVINLDNVTQENTKIQFKLALYSRPSIQKINDWRLWIRKIKWIA